jgi:hypothetical protein
LNLGFSKIYLYDNEDEPVYEKLLNNPKVKVMHFPGNKYECPVQYQILNHFVSNYMYDSSVTHVIHMDLDEFIVLKKHKNISDFILEYINGNCGAIAINWRHFGSNGHLDNNGEPLTKRFTKCEKNGNNHIKVLFDKDHFVCWRTVHTIDLTEGHFVKTTHGFITGNIPWNEHIDFSVIQMNHYKCKTLPEFKYIRTRGCADRANQEPEDVVANFNKVNLNEIEELSAYNFYNKSLTTFLNEHFCYNFEGYSQQVPEQIQDLINLCKYKKNILEIGFNAGHSAEIFLKNSNCNLTSFDLNSHNYVSIAKEYIDIYYPGRHELILGDSTLTIPLYKENSFDLLFIDGGHEYNIAKADLDNCKRFANDQTIIIMDDVIFSENSEFWTIGPTKAWKESNLITFGYKEYSKGRGMVWGKYLFSK